MIEPKEPWFAQKRYGYGAGLPIAWQGWALVGGFFAVMLFARWLSRLPGTAPHITAFALILAATATVIVVSHRRTRGGWRWRWGGE